MPIFIGQKIFFCKSSNFPSQKLNFPTFFFCLFIFKIVRVDLKYFSAILSSLAVVWDVRVAQNAFVLNSFDKQQRLAIGPRRVCVSQEILLYWPWHRIHQRRNVCVSVCRVLYTFFDSNRMCVHVRKLQISIGLQRKFRRRWPTSTHRL